MKKTIMTLMVCILCALTAQAQTYWDGTADKNLPGDGTEASPYLISTPEQLAGLAARVNDDGEDFRDKFIQLANDIYLTELAEGKDTLDWEPIGHQVWKWGEETKYAYFRGTFDGAGHTIHNLYYGKGADFGVGFDPLDLDTELSDMDFSAYCKGLFCNVDGGTIKNLNLQNAMMSGVLNVALIATYLSEGSTVSNCHVQGKMHGTQVSLGGIVSKNEGLIENCTADIQTEGAGMGGIVYENQTTGVVRNCSVTGTARCTAGNGGGLVNYNYGLIERCSASVDIQALYGTNGAVNSNTGYKVYSVHYAGGFVVYNWMGGIIRECYATGNLSSEGNSQLGGFGLYNYGRIESCYSTGLLKDITDYNTLAGSVGMAQFVRYNGELAHHDGDAAFPGDCINCFTTSVCELRKDDNKDEGFYRNNCAAFLYEYNHGQAGFSDPYTSYSREIGCYWNKEGIPQISGNYNCYLGKEYTVSYMQSQAFVDELNKLARFLGTSQWEYRAGQLPRATGIYTKDASDFFAGGDGSKENPYLIGNKEQLENMSYLVNQGFDFDNCYIKQTADIALNAPMEQWGEEMPTEWQPIGGSHKYELLDAAVDYPFKGSYDGDFHEVQNMYIDNLLANQGFFGLLGKNSQNQGVTIRNLGVTGAYVRAFSAGILAGKVLTGYNIIQCWTSGDAASQGSNPMGIGALAADLTERGRVLNCMSTAKLYSAGGAQYVAGTVDAMCNYRSWAGDSIVNYLYAGVLENLSNSTVPSRGFHYVENPFIDTDVAGDLRVNIQYNRTTAWLQSKECVNTYNDAVDRWNAAHADNDELQLNYWEWREGQYPRVNPSADYRPGVTVAFESNGGTTVITRKVTEGSLIEAPARPEKDGMVFAGWYRDEALTQFFDFEHTMVTNDMTLYAKWLEDTRFVYDLTPFNNKFATTFHIKTAAQLRGFAVAVNGEYTITKTENTGMYGDKYMSYTYTQTRAPQSFEGKTVVLDNDIFLNDTTDWQYWGHNGYAVPWKPIGSYTTGEAGGTQADVEFTGTFDGQGHSVYGMYIEMGAMPMYQQFYYGLFGITKGGAVIKNVGVRASAIDATDHQNELGTYAGAAFGGGSLLVGRAVATSISQCFTEGNIVNVHAEQSYVGGLIGQIDYEYTGKTAVDNCYSRVNIANTDGTAEGSLYYAYTSEKTITNCYLAGHVKDGSSDFYYDKELVANAGTYNTGKTTNEMKAKSTYEGWDFETVWGRNNDINDGYPYLRQFYTDAPADDPDPVKVTGITLSQTEASMMAGETLQLTANVLPADAQNKNVKWQALTETGIYGSPSDWASVDENGLVTANNLIPLNQEYYNGRSEYVYVIATTLEGDFKAICKIAVKQPTVKFMTVDGRRRGETLWRSETDLGKSDDMLVNWQYKYVFYTDPEEAIGDSKNVEWSVEDASIATVEAKGDTIITVNGKEQHASWAIVTGLKKDFSTTIKVRTEQNIEYKNLIWFQEIAPDDNSSMQIFMQGGDTGETLSAGQTLQLYTQYWISSKWNWYANYKLSYEPDVQWESSDPTIATVDENGLLTAVGDGKVTITAKLRGTSLSATTHEIICRGIPVTSVSINSDASTTMQIGSTQQLTATVAPANATNQNVTWSSSNEQVLTVSETGLVTAVGAGSASITATVDDKSNGVKTASVTITVNELTMTVVSEGYTGTYDGQAHGIAVTAPDDAIVKYGTAKGTYNLDAAPAYTDAGNYTVYYQVTKPNYTTVENSVAVSIAKAPLTITVGSYTKKQYDPIPEFTVSYEGFVNNETAEVLTKQPVLSCEANEDSAPGEYDITLSGAEATNYDIKYVAGNLTVTEPDSYTLTYMLDDKIYKVVTYKYRETITPEPIPEGNYVTFEWTGLPETMPAHDVVVHASYTTGIRDLILAKPQDVQIYSPNGKKLNKLQKGLNIVMLQDGTIRKIVIK